MKKNGMKAGFLALILMLITISTASVANGQYRYGPRGNVRGNSGRAAASGILGRLIGIPVRNYYQRRGAVCYTPPRLIPGALTGAWYAGTCARRVY
jgi:hypothetical protein